MPTLPDTLVRWACGHAQWPHAAPVPRHLQAPQQTLEAMLRPKVTTLPGHIQAVYVQNVVKLYASILQQKEQAADTEAAQEVTQLLVERLPQFVQSADLEVQERVRLQTGDSPHSSCPVDTSRVGMCPTVVQGCPPTPQRSSARQPPKGSTAPCIASNPRGVARDTLETPLAPFQVLVPSRARRLERFSPFSKVSCLSFCFSSAHLGPGVSE